jgi:soluble lytic murein transglycosylase-like protein
MATSTVLIPQAGLKLPSKWGRRDNMVTYYKKGLEKYGKFFQQASETSKIPVSLLMAFAIVESGMNPNANTGLTTGMMQWNRNYADEYLTYEYKLGRMSEKEKEILKRKGLKWDANGKFAPITAQQQLDPELNILIGSIYLGQYADSIIGGKKSKNIWGKDGDIIRLDRIITVYNLGPYHRDSIRAMTTNTSPLELANSVNNTTSTYIHKILGKDGALDVASKEFKDLIS